MPATTCPYPPSLSCLPFHLLPVNTLLPANITPDCWKERRQGGRGEAGGGGRRRLRGPGGTGGTGGGTGIWPGREPVLLHLSLPTCPFSFLHAFPTLPFCHFFLIFLPSLFSLPSFLHPSSIYIYNTTHLPHLHTCHIIFFFHFLSSLVTPGGMLAALPAPYLCRLAGDLLVAVPPPPTPSHRLIKRRPSSAWRAYQSSPSSICAACPPRPQRLATPTAPHRCPHRARAFRLAFCHRSVRGAVGIDGVTRHASGAWPSPTSNLCLNAFPRCPILTLPSPSTSPTLLPLLSNDIITGLAGRQATASVKWKENQGLCTAGILENRRDGTTATCAQRTCATWWAACRAAAADGKIIYSRQMEAEGQGTSPLLLMNRNSFVPPSPSSYMPEGGSMVASCPGAIWDLERTPTHPFPSA